MLILATFPWGMELSLLQLVFLVLLVALPILSKKVEHNLELFFLVMAVARATLAGDLEPRAPQGGLPPPAA
jgi:hypothetical protein